MSTSTIKLYASANTEAGAWKLLPQKLFKIDNISDYLAQFTPLTINDHAYVKNGLEISVKFNMTQDKSQPNATSGYKYVSIQNTSENIAYYFVKKTTWLSANAVRFDLVMDVLNTYNDGTHYVFKPNTRILREHKDRFVKNLIKATINIAWVSSGESAGTVSMGQEIEARKNGISGTLIFKGKVSYHGIRNVEIDVNTSTYPEEDINAELEDFVPGDDYLYIKNEYGNYFAISDLTWDWDYTFGYYRKIDPVAENINPLLQNGDANGTKMNHPTSLLNQDWYLLYRNQNDPSESLVNPVDCFLIPQNETKVDSAYIIGGRLIPSWLEDGKWYAFNLSASVSATLSNGQTATQQSVNGVYQLLITKAGEKINVIYMWGSSTSERWGIYWQYDDIDYITFSSTPAYYHKYDSCPDINLAWATTSHGDTAFNNSGSDSIIDGVDKVDRTDSKNIKLIKLPYCPYPFTINVDKLETNGNTDWDYAEITQSGGGKLLCLKLKNMATKLHADITWSSGTYHPFQKLHLESLPISINQTRVDMDDSKLLHSEFFKPNYYYDSFSFALQLEKCVISSYYDSDEYNNLKIRYDVTSTINSRFMFTFKNYYINYGEQNYPKNLIIVRNNEEVLYNVAFINYVRTGYNFDQKAKNLTNIANWTGVGLSAVSIGASLLAPSVPLKVAGVVGAVVSMVTSIKSAITTSIQSEQTLQNKILQTQNQTSSVAGSDDVDLMSVYAENRLKYVIYQPMPNMKNLLNDLFFYAGYNSGRMGLPNHNTRYNFDYLECDAVLESAGANLPQEIIDEIKNCYKTGVTFIHKTARTTNKWDIEQKYENWENSLMED